MEKSEYHSIPASEKSWFLRQQNNVIAVPNLFDDKGLSCYTSPMATGRWSSRYDGVLAGRFYLLGIAGMVLLMAGCVSDRGAYNPEDLETLIARKNVPYLLVDVRSQGEFANGHIPTAINIPLEKIPLWLLEIDKSTLVFLYCHTGIRAAIAAEKLRSAGFANVVVYGGIGMWRGQFETGELAN
jgi:rhodanese-related sulfurtransferase